MPGTADAAVRQAWKAGKVRGRPRSRRSRGVAAAFVAHPPPVLRDRDELVTRPARTITPSAWS